MTRGPDRELELLGFEGKRLRTAAASLHSKRVRAIAKAWPQLTRAFWARLVGELPRYISASTVPNRPGRWPTPRHRWLCNLLGIARPLASQLAALLRVAGPELRPEDRSAAVFGQAAAEFGFDAVALAALAGWRQGKAPAEDVADIFGRVHTSATRAAEVAAALEVPE